jgi:hypothetical protein
MSKTEIFRARHTPEKKYRVIKNSEVIKIGDWITNENTGMANVDGVTEKIDGFATDILTRDRISLRSASVDTSTYTGTWAASTNQYTASATNADAAGDAVLVEYIEPREGDLVLATLSAAKGSTTGSNKAGYYLSINTSDSSQLLETSASTSRASTQFEVVDPYNQGSTTEVVVRVSVRGADMYTAN